MPRRKGSASTASAIRQVRRQAGAVLAKLRKDIRAMETELARLKHDEDLWGRPPEAAVQAAPLHVPRELRAAAVVVAPAVAAEAEGESTGAACSRSCPAVQGFQCSPDPWTQGQAPVGNLCRDHALDRSWLGQAQDSRALRKILARKAHHRLSHRAPPRQCGRHVLSHNGHGVVANLPRRIIRRKYILSCA